MRKLLILLMASLGMLVSLFEAVLPAQAVPNEQVYYVDQGHPLASDSNPGSPAAPWLTISHAAEVAAAVREFVHG